MLPLIEIHHPSRRLSLYTENYTGDIELKHCKLKCKIKYRHQDTLKLNFSLWPNWTRPDPPFPPNFLTRPDPTRPDPRVGSRVVQLWFLLTIHRKSYIRFSKNPLRDPSPPSWILTPKCKTRFSRKLSNLEIWSLLTTYRKSYMGFSKNPLWDP